MIKETGLNPELVTWARERRWEQFTDAQRRCFAAILGSDDDLILTGRTASGKTEAVFFPLLTIAARREAGVSVLGLIPMKALINDQHRRLLSPAERVNVPLFKWHGEAQETSKRRLIKEQRGVVLMTVESLEGRFLRQPLLLKTLFGSLDAIVIDELHEYLGGSRGHQLASLLARLDDLCGTRARRIALSATLADVEYPKKWLSPNQASAIHVIRDSGSGQKLLSKIRGYQAPPPEEAPVGRSRLAGRCPSNLNAIASTLFETYRGGTHLVFAGSKRDVETLTSNLARRAHDTNIPNRFRPHHGSLAKQPRESLEWQLRSGEPLTVITTTTLELGIDIGGINTVHQIGAPTVMAAFRQRIGRSGRQNDPAMLTIHVTENELSSTFGILDRLRLGTARAVAALNLLERRFVEPAQADGTVLSVVFQQTLSMINQRGGATFLELYRLMRSITPFARVSSRAYEMLLKSLCEGDLALLHDRGDGKYLLTRKGERLLDSNEFYATFKTGAVWDIWSQSGKIGSMSFANPVAVGDRFYLDGRGWKVLSVQRARTRVIVEPAKDGRIPLFDFNYEETVHAELAVEMRNVLGSGSIPPDCDMLSARHLGEGQAAYRDLDLENYRLIADGENCHIFSWAGTKFNAVLALLLRTRGIACMPNEVGVMAASTTPAEMLDALAMEDWSVKKLALSLEALRQGKFDKWIPEELLREDWASRHADVEETLRRFCHELSGSPS